jgi:hypothetical protein
MSNTYEKRGREIGELVDRKNAAYGSSFMKSGEFLRLLFPAGVPPHRLEDALLLVRIFDKQMRIATDQDAFGESPFADIAGYGLLGAQQHAERKSKGWQGSVSDQDASNSSKAQPASVASPRRTRITTIRSANGEPAPSPTQNGCSPQSENAGASNATEAVSPGAAVPLSLSKKVLIFASWFVFLILILLGARLKRLGGL